MHLAVPRSRGVPGAQRQRGTLRCQPAGVVGLPAQIFQGMAWPAGSAAHRRLAVDREQGLVPADAQRRPEGPFRPHHRAWRGDQAGVRGGVRGGARGSLALEGGDELADPALVLRPVHAAEVAPDPAGRERRQLHVTQQHRDQPLAAGDRPGDHGGVLLPHPRPGHRGRAGDQDPVEGAEQPRLKPVDEHVARADLPLVEEDMQPGSLQVLGQRADPLGIVVAVGDEHIPRLVHRTPQAEQSLIGA